MGSEARRAIPRRSAFADARVVLGLALTLPALVFGCGLALGLRTDPREKRALETPYSIIGVTEGTEPLILGAAWQKIALRLKPELAPVIGGAVLRCPSASPGCLVVWQHYNRAGFWSGPPPMLEIACSNELGHSMREVISTNDFLTAHGESIFPFVVTHFPKRGEIVQVTAADPFRRSDGDSIRVLNPTPGPYLVWQPEALPATTRSENLIGSVREFRAGAAEGDSSGVGEDVLRLLIKDPHGTASDWTAERLEVSDATGNTWAVTPDGNWLQTTAESGGLTITWHSLALSPEGAFRVRVTLVRANNLPAAETAILHDLPVPETALLHTERRAAKIQGSTVEATLQIGIHAAEGVDADRGIGWSADAPAVALRLRNAGADRVLRIRRPGSGRWEAPDIRLESGHYCILLPEADSGKRVSLEVALTRTRTLEFLLRPAIGEKEDR